MAHSRKRSDEPCVEMQQQDGDTVPDFDSLPLLLASSNRSALTVQARAWEIFLREGVSSRTGKAQQKWP